jgi:serine protease Do
VTRGSVRRRGGIAALLLVLLASAGLTPGVLAQGALTQIQTDVDQLVRNGRPSVVTVVARRTVTKGRGRTGPRTAARVGTGVAVGENEILTTARVIQRSEQVTIRTANGLQSEAEIVGVDPVSNLALLRVADLRFPAVRMANDTPHVGEWVVTLGTSYRAEPTQSVGTVAYLHREPRLLRLQITNAAYPGNSGGPAFNARGELIGIVQGALEEGPEGEESGASSPRQSGTSFVLAAESMRPLIESLRRDGHVTYGFLGVSTRAASVESITEAGAVVPIGAQVERVASGGPAEMLGLREGDLIVAFDGERVEYPEQLARWVAITRPGAKVELIWVRDDTPRTGHVVLGRSPVEMPLWALGPAPQPRPVSSDDRIADLERQIIELSRELNRLKTERPSPPNP